MAIYDTMQSLQSSVATHCVGFAYNLATFLLAAGEKVLYNQCLLIKLIKVKSILLTLCD